MGTRVTVFFKTLRMCLRDHFQTPIRCIHEHLYDEVPLVPLKGSHLWQSRIFKFLCIQILAPNDIR